MTAWSLAHGLATLMLEGKFEKMLGARDEERQSAIDAVFAQFEAMMRAR